MTTVPHLEYSYIDGEALRLLTTFAQKRGVAEIAPPIPIDEIIEHHLGVQFDIEDLSWLGQGVLGATWMEGSGKIAVHAELENDTHQGRLCFTMAHEVGHWVLHRPLFQAAKIQGSLFDTVRETKPSIFCREVGRASKKARGEYQADRFAGSLMMPKKFVDEAWRKAVGPQRVSMSQEAKYAKQDFQAKDEYARTLAESVRDEGGFENVSVAAMAVRLKELGWLVMDESKGRQRIFGL